MRSRQNPYPCSATTYAALGELPSPTPESALQCIALDRLTLSPAPRRRFSLRSIRDLADRIQANGQFRSLMVVAVEDFQYCVVAGERRFAALRLLARQGRIAPTFGVPCRVIKAKATLEPVTVAEFGSTGYHSEAIERRRRFINLLKECPGLQTGSEFAAHQCLT